MEKYLSISPLSVSFPHSSCLGTSCDVAQGFGLCCDPFPQAETPERTGCNLEWKTVSARHGAERDHCCHSLQGGAFCFPKELSTFVCMCLLAVAALWNRCGWFSHPPAPLHKPPVPSRAPRTHGSGSFTLLPVLILLKSLAVSHSPKCFLTTPLLTSLKTTWHF